MMSVCVSVCRLVVSVLLSIRVVCGVGVVRNLCMMFRLCF